VPNPLVPGTAPAPIDLSAARRILAVRLDNVGDVVLTGPALRAIRAAAPDARLALLCSPAGRHGARLLRFVDETIAARVAWQDVGGRLPLDPGRELGLVARLREGAFDAAFVFTSFSQTPFPPAFACYLAGIPVRVGQARDFGGSLLTHAVVPAPDGTHQADRNLHLVEAVGIPVADRSLEVDLPRDAVDHTHRLLADVGVDPLAPFVVLAPGASAAARRYPPERFGTVARLLAVRLGWPAVVVGAASDQAAAGTILAAAPGARSLVGRTTTAEWAAVIGGARLLVTSHSAPLHLADALRTPVVCPFAGTDRESEWAPRDTPAVLLRQPTDCAPCRLLDCPIGLPCLDVAPEAVADAAIALLDGRRPLTVVPDGAGTGTKEDGWLRFAS
jgi:ADP-heptose:LPS heptosyltransferase